jgi:glycosyltransferase involved in cell wall biosynthesis
MMCHLSFVIPLKDEEETLTLLAAQILDCVQQLGTRYKAEIIFIDDGSTDASWAIIQSLSEQNPAVIHGLKFRRNLGKALALEAGFRAAKGEIIFTLDADLQDDPKEIPRFLAKIDEGYDLVSGWKQTRYDPLSKTLPSKLFNKFTGKLTGVKLNDFNCGFKCYRKEVVENIRLYGELHRYIPVLAADLGYRIGEISVAHHPRRHGNSKYGIERYLRGFVDLITVLATTRWLVKPGHLFGGISLGLGFLGVASLGYLFLAWLFGNGPIGGRPLLFFGVLTSLAALQMLSLGIIAEFHVKSNPVDLTSYISRRTGT